MVRSFALVGLLGLIACGSKGSGAAEPAVKPDCTAAANGLLGIGKMKPEDPKAAPMRAAIVARCTEDDWTATATTCLGGATDHSGLKECRYRTLTGLQSDGLDKAAGELLSPIEPLMAKMAGFSDQMCACKDAECARRVSDEMTAWSQELAKKDEEPPKLSEDQQKRAMAIGTKMGECMQKAMGMSDDPPPAD